MSRKVGIFGGTFDPPHRGHVTVAADVAEALDLDVVLWIPAGDPPHKRELDTTSAPLRLRMVRAVTALDPRFEVSEIEVVRDGPSYTVDTLRSIHSDAPEAELYLIMGMDQYRAFESWREPDEIRGLASLAVMDRDGEGLEPTGEGADGLAADAGETGGGHGPPGTAGARDVLRVPVTRVDISSTRVRAAADRGESIADLVTPEVARIIEAEGLYRRRRR